MSYEKPIKAKGSDSWSKAASEDEASLYGIATDDNLKAVRGRRVEIKVDLAFVRRLAARYPEAPDV